MAVEDWESPLSRVNLKKYYKKVHTCNLCKKPYGLENVEKDINICPICSQKLHHDGRRKKKGKFYK